MKPFQGVEVSTSSNMASTLLYGGKFSLSPWYNKSEDVQPLSVRYSQEKTLEKYWLAIPPLLEQNQQKMPNTSMKLTP
ncbi:hypothetical protein KJ693_01685 [bacterium]|nr:hypothetical protein [bacterium]